MSIRTVRSIIEGQALLTAAANLPVADAARLMRTQKVGAILVVDGEQLAGIFTERDALFRVVAEGRDPRTTQVGDVMTANPTTIGADKPFARAMELMHAGRFRHVPVVDNGHAIGIVSSRDAMGPELEQFMYTLIVEDQVRDVLA
ncbi:MAG: CBS domain-containing protein [Gammaproteobacteria bacterium]|nr:CBS domain-containing protein [Gammaproteobacteria bacterium]